MHRAPRKYDSIVVDYSAPHAHVRVSCDEGRERSGLTRYDRLERCGCRRKRTCRKRELG